MRPFFPYYGSKWNIARYYPKPKYEIIIEPFAGSAGYSIFYNHERVILYELDPIVSGVWRYLIEAQPEDIQSLPDLPNVGDSVDDYPLCDGAKWLIGFWLNRGSATPKKSRTAYSARTDKGQLNWGQRAKDRISSQLPLISRWLVINGSYREAQNRNVTWFIDPPYTKKGKYYREKFSGYNDLGQWCLNRIGQVIVCEGINANWLPFVPLGSFKTSSGRSEEVVYIQEKPLRLIKTPLRILE
jgi:site-specific DNA-adenine methylase